ncbi:GH3 auxin-responsive promoter family protein [Leptolyngbya cf. ectocarpi LEGE 11479]|uniref:GH3 auxin-responsive promoter family protein n=1 Tax=Leptolyngbya cf. ectocarpi LEGE 11479 TaxID=1828722 RepID=A0A928ZWG2_LEPEC|nr:GH3 auxin-responsive promoter family protein [Leptolyngbya ectocarpi]MBE9068728.1 GH3 auxin-responsive promoter family protein [Leptolyngbya cf. ectocarpi LEGE 11479]
MRWLIKTLGMLLAPAAKRFSHALFQPQTAQQRLQKQLFKQLMQSDYGQSLKISSIDDWHRIPIVTYDDLFTWIEQKKSLTSDPVLFYEKTSGSGGPAKRIPYTHGLRKSFNTLFCIWAYDLITHGPRFKTGKLYMCISPKLLAPGESPEGLQDDADYLDRWLRWLLKPFLVSSVDAHKPQLPEVFQSNLCKALLLEENLETISIWSPSFLSVQLDYIQTHRQALCTHTQLSPARAELLKSETIDWEALWPQLKLISCWDSAIAADQASSLKARFPNTLIQGKGLLATEAPMTVPLMAANGCVPLITEVFFEFEDDRGQIYRLHELELSQTYSVIISQKGGLYRYRMCDRIQVTHYYQATPCLKFLGRSHTTSDMVGEKLTLDFVSQILEQLHLPTTAFKCLTPVLSPQPYYILLTDYSALSVNDLTHSFEQLLCQSFHYRQARLLGQLQPVQVYATPDVLQRLMQYHYQQGKRLGDVKYPCLLTQPIPPDVYEIMDLQPITQ